MTFGNLSSALAHLSLCQFLLFAGASVAFAYPAIDTDVVSHCGAVADGTTDNTPALEYCISSLPSDTRGILRVPFNVVYDFEQVAELLPVGVILKDYSLVNWSFTSGYKQKAVTLASKDAEADDTNLAIVSWHHPALVLNNLGTTETASAVEKKASIVFAGGFLPSGAHDRALVIQSHKNSNTFNKWALDVMNDNPTSPVILRMHESKNVTAYGGISGGSFTHMAHVPTCATIGTMIFIGGSITGLARPTFYKGSGQWVNADGSNSIYKARSAGCP